MTRFQHLILVILAICLGFALRLYHLNVVPLRGDEAFSALNWAEMPIQQSLSEIATIEPHPPLTYVIFNVWNAAIGGIDSPFALRMLGVLTNTLGIAGIFALTKRLTRNRSLALIAGFMWAIHPFEIWHSQDFRNYALWASLSVIALWSALRLFDTRNRRDWLLYSILATVTAFTFYTELLMLGALGVFAILTLYRHRDFLIRFLTLQTVIVGSVFLSFLVLQGNLLAGGGYGGNVESFSALGYITRFLPTLTFGETIPNDLSSIGFALFFVYTSLLLIVFKNDRRQTLFLILLSMIPLLLLGLASLRISIFHPRYVISVVPIFLIILVIGIDSCSRYLQSRLNVPRNIIIMVFLTPWILISAATTHNYRTDPALRKAPAWDELADFLNVNVTEEDLVIQLSTDAAFGYYYDGLADDRGLPANPQQPASEIISVLESASEEYASIYVVSNAISSWPNADVVENWTNENMQQVRLSNASGLGIRQYKNWDINSSEYDEILANFDNTIALVGYELFENPLPTGEIVLWVYWQATTQTDTSLKSFVHLIGEGGLLAQDDKFLQDRRLDTTSWNTDTVFRDVYYLSTESLVTGEYEILVGWYNPEDSTRLTIESGEDSYRLVDLTYP